ncbi:hypothetical protein KJ870_06595 [bacterium]|nr:hypothetical protein [bacterium]MBU1434585.1 hypothetical protein [bacterium]MBU1502163.1 hypothetical protein [bacterium]
MKLAYAGPKPIISHTGITFDKNKEDKYSYLGILVKLLNALNHEYLEDKTYVCSAEISPLSNDELYRELKKYCDNLDEIIKFENHAIECQIEHDLDRAHQNLILNDAAKETLENNIKIMHDYMIQRSINKSVYYCGIHALAKIIEREKIEHITVPMFIKYTHVLHSVQGVLRTEKRPVESDLSIFEEDEKLFAKLKIIYI